MHTSRAALVALSFVLAAPLRAQQAMPHFDQTPPAPADPKAFGPEVVQAYARVRKATADFVKLDAAVAAGFAATVATCYDDPQHGAMGYHHVSKANADKILDLDHPQILLYERRADGSYGLNGVEFLVPYRVWPADSTPPRLMGQTLHQSAELQLWYLHMWTWTPNKAGLFANWNPDVKCRKPPA